MRYRIKVMDAFGRLLANRTYVFQQIGKLAAISLPTAELLRMRDECNGNLELAFEPIRKALSTAGFTDVIILPAQTAIVELVPDQVDATTTNIDESGFVELSMAKSAVEEFNQFRVEFETGTPKLPQRLKLRYEAICRRMAAMEIELWRPS